MKVRVHEDRCAGHAMCVIACPDVFTINEETGHAEIVAGAVSATLEDDVEAAQDSCPEQAIEIY